MAVYEAPSENTENAHFAAATPSGELTFTVTNPAVLGSFEPGDFYYLDLIKAAQ